MGPVDSYTDGLLFCGLGLFKALLVCRACFISLWWRVALSAILSRGMFSGFSWVVVGA